MCLDYLFLDIHLNSIFLDIHLNGLTGPAHARTVSLWYIKISATAAIPVGTAYTAIVSPVALPVALLLLVAYSL